MNKRIRKKHATRASEWGPSILREAYPWWRTAGEPGLRAWALAGQLIPRRYLDCVTVDDVLDTSTWTPETWRLLKEAALRRAMGLP